MQNRYYHHAALCGFLGLFFLQMAWHTLLFPAKDFPVALMLLIVIGPLLAPFRGFLNCRLKSCTWMSYISLPYFIHGVMEAYASRPELPYALLEILFSLLLCFGAGLYVYKTE